MIKNYSEILQIFIKDSPKNILKFPAYVPHFFQKLSTDYPQIIYTFPPNCTEITFIFYISSTKIIQRLSKDVLMTCCTFSYIFLNNILVT